MIALDRTFQRAQHLIAAQGHGARAQVVHLLGLAPGFLADSALRLLVERQPVRILGDGRQCPCHADKRRETDPGGGQAKFP